MGPSSRGWLRFKRDEASGQLGLDSEDVANRIPERLPRRGEPGALASSKDVSCEARSREFKSRRPHHITGDIGKKPFCHGSWKLTGYTWNP